MRKMDKLVLDIIRFETEDIIVTSGGSPSLYSGLTGDTTYFTWGSEINQSNYKNSEGYKIKDGSFYKFRYSPESNTINLFQRDQKYTIGQIGDEREFYAWYDTGGWFTEGLTKNSYLPDNWKY